MLAFGESLCNAIARRPSGGPSPQAAETGGPGIGSGHGKTSSKGHKGHASRQGFKLNPIFEGGQMPLARRVPKRGFFNGAFKKEYAIVNLDDIEAASTPARLSTRPPCEPRGSSRATISTGSRSWAMAR